MSDIRDTETPVELPGTRRHPSGWWKARDGKWYRPDEQPAPEITEQDPDLVTALSIAVGAVVLGSVLGAHHELTLLFGGIAGALVARWWLFSRHARVLLTTTAALCAAAATVLTADVARAAHSSGAPQSSVLVATTGAVMATGLALAVRRGPA